MHQFDQMTEPEIGKVMAHAASAVKKRLPPDTAFIILAVPFGPNRIAQYVSNAEREDCIEWLRETADRFEFGETMERT